jgi:membrane associated rhomboid family serine protease
MQLRLSEFMKKLLITYVVVFVIQHVIDRFLGGNFHGWLGLVPEKVFHGAIWQLMTYSFLHVDVMHLVLNLLVLAFLASDIESAWGRRRFLIFYGFCILFAAIFYLATSLLVALSYPVLGLPMMGASGGIYGLLVAYAILFPERELLFMMLFPMKSKQFILILAGVEFLQALFSGQSGLSAIAHLSGMAAAWIFLWLQAKGIKMDFERKASSSTSSKKRSSHLKLVPGQKDDDSGVPRTWH